MALSQQSTFDFAVVLEARAKKVVEKEKPASKDRLIKKVKKAKDDSVTAKAPAKRGRKSLKEADAEADLIDIPHDELLFQKQYYSMGEVADMFKVNASLIRFWENHFDILQPKKNKRRPLFSSR